MMEHKDREISPPTQYEDCNGYIAELGACKILSEMFCITRGKCKFYKAKEKKI